MSNEKSLFIFRRDLRLEDNTGLISALNHGGRVIPCFILDKRLLESTPSKLRNINAIQFMLESLKDQQLKQKNARLHLFFGKVHEIIEELITKEEVISVHFNNDYTIFSKKRDDDIYNICEKRKMKCFRYSDSLLTNDPRSIVKPSDEKPYTIFTHFFNKAAEVPVLKPQSNIYSNYYSRNTTPDEIEDRKKEEVYNQILTIQESILEVAEVNA